MQDFILNGIPHGDVASRLVANGNMEPGMFRPYIKCDKAGRPLGLFVNVAGGERPVANATLRYDEWKEFDSALVQAAKLRLKAIAAIQSRGLVYNIGGGWGKTVLATEKSSELGDAEINMDGITRGKNDRVDFGIDYLPLPIVHKGFQINARVLAESRTGATPLDTIQVTEATFKVAEKLEDMLLNGASSYAYGGGTIYGFLDFPQRETYSFPNGHWNDMVNEPSSDGSVGEQILQDVLAMIQKSMDVQHYGPWVLFIPSAYETVLSRDYTSTYAKSIRARLLETGGLEDIVTCDKLTADRVVLAQMTPDVVRLVTAMPLTNIEWQVEGNMVTKFKVMAIMVPQVRADANNKSGIVVAS